MFRSINLAKKSYFKRFGKQRRLSKLLAVKTCYKSLQASTYQKYKDYKQKSYAKFNMKSLYFLFGAGLFTLANYSELLNKYYDTTSESCGIIGYIGTEKLAEKVLLEGIQILQYRGYDSCGLVTVDENGNFVVHKKSSSSAQGGDCITSVVDMARGMHNHDIGIAHTRWATHGGKTDMNAHPHFDRDKRFSVVHNGMIENYYEIKNILKEHGIEQQSETDTELIALYTKFLVDSEGLSTEEAFRKCFQAIDGCNCCLLIDKTQPDKIFAVKNAGSLLVGIGEHGFVIASQCSAFQNYTRQYVELPNNEVIVLTKDKIILKDKVFNEDDVKSLVAEMIHLKPKPQYKWFFEQEIYEQPEAISKTLNYGARITKNNRVKLGGLDSREDDLKAISNLVISACGSSLHAGMFGAILMRRLGCFDSITPYSSSDITEDFFLPKNTGLLSISQSGETEDVKKALRIALDKEVVCFNVINEVNSEIARMANLGVFINAGREVSVASTKAFFCQVKNILIYN